LKSLNKALLLFIFIFSFVVGCAGAPEEELPEVTATPRPTPIITPTPEVPDFDQIECSHFWRLPDCHTPRYCLDCGEISAGPTPHEPAGGNFQQPPVCILCGDIVGEVLPPNFTTLGFQINTTFGRSYDFLTVTSEEPTIATTGTVSLLFVDIFETEEGYPRVPGHQFIRARIMMLFDDESAREHGYMYIIGHVDYYSMNLNDPSLPFDELAESDIEGFRISNRTLNLNGEEREYFIRYEEIMSTWVDGVAHVMREYTFIVPIGYDGMVIYLSNAANWRAGGNRILSDNIDNNTLFFRLVGQTG